MNSDPLAHFGFVSPNLKEASLARTKLCLLRHLFEKDSRLTEIRTPPTTNNQQPAPWFTLFLWTCPRHPARFFALSPSCSPCPPAAHFPKNPSILRPFIASKPKRLKTPKSWSTSSFSPTPTARASPTRPASDPPALGS